MTENSLKVRRFLGMEKDHSAFLFGPRGSGKTTFIQDCYPKSLIIDLLDIEQEEKFTRNPNELKEIVANLSDETEYIVIDEIQKIPKLLDMVHLLIESTDKYFILTGSSARKLKRGKANLLAGRAFTYHLHALTSLELGDLFTLRFALEWGLLPKIYQLKTDRSKNKFLRTYTSTYLREEIAAEQHVRNLEPFRYFLELAAQMNGKIINFTKLSRSVGVDGKTVKEYYSILEDTLLGFTLRSFEHSFRKQLSTKPKFYLFDTGIKRALANSLTIPLQEGTYAYGEAFEHFIVLECIKLASYFHEEYRFSYLRTKDDLEIDLVVERPGRPILFIEIKSSKQVREEDLTTYSKLIEDFGKCEAICLSRDSIAKRIDNIRVLPWQEGLREYFC